MRFQLKGLLFTLIVCESVDAFLSPIHSTRNMSPSFNFNLSETRQSIHLYATVTNNVDLEEDIVSLDEKALMEENIIVAIEQEASAIVEQMTEDFDEECVIDKEGLPVDELCADESKLSKAKSKLKSIIRRTIGLVRTTGDDGDISSSSDEIFGDGIVGVDDEDVPEGELLERGWEKRGNASALRRNAEVWKFALSCVFKVLAPRKLRKKGASEEEILAAKTAAATYIRNGLLRLGPSFVKLGQVVSTRTDVLPVEYTDVLKSLQDDVPGFSGKRAKEIVSKELGTPVDKIFQKFSEKPLAAASLVSLVNFRSSYLQKHFDALTSSSFPGASSHRHLQR